jgi:hypothetical protein
MKKIGLLVSALTLGVTSMIACGDDESPATPGIDAGPEAAPPVDSGVDPGVDAGVDACAPMTVSAVTPKFAWKDGRTPITITGTGFVATPKIFLATGATATPIQHAAFVSATSMTAVVPPAAFTSGTYDLRIVNPNGCSATLAGAIKVVDQAPPTVLSVEPSAGTNQNDVPVTILGCHFDANATVSVVTSAGVVTVMPAPTGYTAGANDERCGNTPLYSINAVVQTKTSGLVPGAYLIRVTNPTPGSFGEYASFVVSNPSGNPGSPEVASAFTVGRRSLALVAGRIDDANRYLYAIGGENAGGDALDTVEIAQVDRFGQLGKWAVQRNKLPVALSGAAAVRSGKTIYVIGGTSSKNGTGGLAPTGTPSAKVYRASILSPAGAPIVKDPPTVGTAPDAGGTLAKGTWYYKVAAVTADGEESLASDEVVATLTASGSVKLEWTAPPSVTVTSYNVYRSAAADGVSQSELLLATVNAPALTYTDDGSKTPTAGATYLAAGATSRWVADAKQLTTARLDTSAAAVKAANGNTYLYVTGGWGTAQLKSVEYAQLQLDGTLGAFAAGPDLKSARMRHGTHVLDKSTGPVNFVGDGGATGTTSFLVAAGGRGTAALDTDLSVEYAVVGADGLPAAWAAAPGFGERDALGFGIANGWFYAFVGAGINGSNINYVQTASSSQASSITATTFTLGSWNSVGSFLSGVSNGKRGRIGLTAESAYFYLAGGTTNDNDALSDVYRVLH